MLILATPTLSLLALATPTLSLLALAIPTLFLLVLATPTLFLLVPSILALFLPALFIQYLPNIVYNLIGRRLPHNSNFVNINNLDISNAELEAKFK